MGASEVIYPELTGGLELMHQTLLRLGYPDGEIHSFADAVSRDHYDLNVSSPGEEAALGHMRAAH